MILHNIQWSCTSWISLWAVKTWFVWSLLKSVWIRLRLSRSDSFGRLAALWPRPCMEPPESFGLGRQNVQRTRMDCVQLFQFQVFTKALTFYPKLSPGAGVFFALVPFDFEIYWDACTECPCSQDCPVWSPPDEHLQTNMSTPSLTEALKLQHRRSQIAQTLGISKR